MKHRLLIFAGAGVLALAWLGPLRTASATAFWAHMTIHMAVVALAAPLLALGLAQTRLDPVRRWPAAFAPLPASALELVVIWSWHTPQLHELARGHAVGMAVEQASFLSASMLVWLSAFGGARRLRHARAASGIAALLVTSMHMTLLGVLLALAPRALYAGSLMCSAASLDPLRDQQIGGVLMLLAGGSSYLIGGLWLLSGLLNRHQNPGAAA